MLDSKGQGSSCWTWGSHSLSEWLFPKDRKLRHLQRRRSNRPMRSILVHAKRRTQKSQPSGRTQTDQGAQIDPFQAWLHQAWELFQMGEDPTHPQRGHTGHWCGGGASSAASVGLPIGNNKAKAKRNGAASLAAMGASIDVLIAEVHGFELQG
jgi:hypothetical protein